jgi:endonuclease G
MERKRVLVMASKPRFSHQVPHLNQNAWNNLEKYSRSLTRTYQNVYVCTGPLFLPR